MILVISLLFALQSASASVILNCTYKVQYYGVVGEVYTCEATVTYTQRDQSRNVVEVSQNHLTGMSNQDVKALLIQSQPIDFIPENIDSFFSNLEAVNFLSCPITSLTKDDLKQFPNLKLFRIPFCQLSTLSGDIFLHISELEFIEHSRL